MPDPAKGERAIFEGALELSSAGERRAYLSAACGDDAELRERVEALLRAHEQAGGFLPEDNPKLGTVRTSSALLPVTEKPGDRIGRYKLREKIGEGGCGVVYVAEQEEPVRRLVALKVIKLGMDTRSVIARFEAERQALAIMDHPNVAKVLDAGATETGRPYFVMELVRGIRITEYCDQNKLSTRERLDLFIKVCQAVQHAHQKGIIHRDIKPSNILVTLHDGVPVPKIIDFGIAKATEGRLTDLTVYTELNQFIGTPAYMSPEQAEMSGLDIDTRSDIYSLGVLLYELLTGQPPFDLGELFRRGLDEIRRTIREVEPPRPSTRLSTLAAASLSDVAHHRHTEAPKLLSLIRGDLDWIVMKALEKDRTRRYETASALAMDLQRCLNHEAVVARPPTNFYRLQKLVRRNKLAFAASGAVLSALFIGLAVSTWLYFREKAAHERAVAAERKMETQATRSTQVAQFLKDMLESVGPSRALGRDTTMLREILDKTAERVGKDLGSQPEVQIELWMILGETYSELGLYQEAQSMTQQALQLARVRYGEEHVATARASVGVGSAKSGLKDFREAERFIRKGLEVQRTLLPPDDPAIAEALDKLSRIMRTDLFYDYDEAEKLQREAIAIKRKSFGDAHPTLPRSLNNLGIILRNQSERREAESLFREAFALSEKSFGRENPEGAMALEHLGHLLMDEGQLAEAESTLRQALAIQDNMLDDDHPNVGRTLLNLALVLEAEDKLAEAESAFRKMFAIDRKVLGDTHGGTIVSLSHLERVVQKQMNDVGIAEVKGLYRLIAEKLRPPAEAGNAEAQYRLALMVRSGRGVAKDPVEAVKWYRRAAEQGHSASANNLGLQYRSGVGVAKDLVEAAKWFRTAAEAGSVVAAANLASIYASKQATPQELAEAVKWYRKAAERRNTLAQIRLAALYATGRGVPKDEAEAVKWYRKAEAEFSRGAARGDPVSLNDLAWLLATAVSDSIRDGRRAVEYAEKAVAATARKNAHYIDTLAAAYAEIGQFEKAIETQKEAMAVLGDESFRGNFETHLKFYEAKSPFRVQ